MKKITIKTGFIEGKERLKLYFVYDKEVVALVKTIPGARWDPIEKSWHVATQAGPVGKLNHLFAGKLLFETDKEIGRQGEGETRRRGDKETR